MNREELNLGRRDDPLDETWVTPKWREEDDDGVTVIPADEAMLREPPERAIAERMVRAERAVATLRHIPTADELHDQRITALVGAIQAAVDFLSLPKTGAKAWAGDLPYHERLTNPKGSGLLDKAVDECRTALDFIAVQEDR